MDDEEKTPTFKPRRRHDERTWKLKGEVEPVPPDAVVIFGGYRRTALGYRTWHELGPEEQAEAVRQMTAEKVPPFAYHMYVWRRVGEVWECAFPGPLRLPARRP